MNVAELTLAVFLPGVITLWWRETPGAEFSPGPATEPSKRLTLSTVVPLSKH